MTSDRDARILAELAEAQADYHRAEQRRIALVAHYKALPRDQRPTIEQMAWAMGMTRKNFYLVAEKHHRTR